MCIFKLDFIQKVYPVFYHALVLKVDLCSFHMKKDTQRYQILI